MDEELDVTPEPQPEPEPELIDDNTPEPDPDPQPEPSEPQAQGKTVPVKALEDERRKRQDLETKYKDLETRVKAQESVPPPKKQPETLEELFDVNPEQALAYVDQQIRAAQGEYDEGKVAQWVQAKTDLVARGLINQQRQTSKGERVSRINVEILKAVPDFEAKRPELVKLARDFGLNDDESEQIFTPEVVGESAARMAKMMDKVYSIVNAGKSAKGKEVKTPPRTEPAGTGGFSNNSQNSKLLDRAKETGSTDDWARLLG